MSAAVTLTLTPLELVEVLHAVRAVVEDTRGFSRLSHANDQALTISYLKLQAARVAGGDIKGVDLSLPPWAAKFVLEAMAPQPKPAKAAAPAKAPKPRRAKRRARKPAAPRPSAGSVADGERDDDDEDIFRPADDAIGEL